VSLQLEDLSKKALISLIRRSWLRKVTQAEMTTVVVEELKETADDVFRKYEAAAWRAMNALGKNDFGEYLKLQAEKEKLFNRWESVHSKIDRLYKDLEYDESYHD